MLDGPEKSSAEKESLETFPHGITPSTREGNEPKGSVYVLSMEL